MKNLWTKFLATDLGLRLVAWYNRTVSAGWYMASSFLANLFGVLVVALPDIINFALQNTDLVTAALMPTLSVEQKAQFLFWVNVAAGVFRIFKQQPVQKKLIEQQADNGQVIPLMSSGVPVSSLQEAADDAVEVGRVVVQEKPPTATHL